MLRRALCAAVLALAMPAGASHGQTAPTSPSAVVLEDSVAALEFGRTVSHWFWTIEPDSLLAHAGPVLRSGTANPNDLANQIFELIGQFGAETGVLDEALALDGGQWVYHRTSRLDASPRLWIVTWRFSPDGVITGVDVAQQEE